jgi:multiple sugar transport system permease protein
MTSTGNKISGPDRVLFRRPVAAFFIYLLLALIAFSMLVPFAWMLSSSLKLNKDVFTFPMKWIPENPRWQNYSDIWTKIPLGTFIVNTVKLSVIVTILQLLSSSFAAYAFAKLRFPGRRGLFLGYIATIAVPWQAYMVPQFIMMRAMGLNNTHLAIICLQAFSAFGVFMMKQFYESIPDELREAAWIDGLSEYGIWLRIMLPLSKPAISTLTIITFVNTWNDFLGPRIYLTRTELQTIQIGLRMFISQYSSEYGLIMAASVVALLPVLFIFLSLQGYFVQGVASSGLKGEGRSLRKSLRKSAPLTFPRQEPV